jgi:hypothetical protein
MFSEIVDVLGNSHFEGYVGGPIAGVVASFIFSWLNAPPNSGNGAQRPRDVYIQINNHYRSESGERRNSATNNGSDDASAAFGIGLLALVASFLFVAYLPQISFALYFSITMVCTFIVSSCLLFWASGRFDASIWLRYTLIPLLLSLAALGIAMQAKHAITPEVINYAHNLLGDGKITFALVLNGTFTFYRNISNEYAQWIIFQMAAFFFVVLSSLIAFFAWLHFTALVNVQASDTRFWRRIVVATHRYSGMSSTFLAAGFLTFAWLFASGEAYNFLAR